jgi:electron transport complex protein RnfC
VKIYSFPHGGISYDDPYAPSREDSVLSYLPWLAVVPLEQENGCTSQAVVEPGDAVREGMLVGRGQGEGSVNVHSPIPGRIVQKVSWKIANTITCSGLLIQLEGEFDKLGKKVEEQRWTDRSPLELRESVVKCGIIEMDSSGRPISDVIASYKEVKEPISLVVRCVFDDPWLVADYVLCREKLKELAEGACITAKMLKAEKIILAVSAPEKKLSAALLSAVQNCISEKNIPDFSVFSVLVGSRYPQRNDRELEIVIRHFEKKERAAFGALLYMGPATICAIHDAVKYQKPPLDRYIAVGGSAVWHPRVLKVRIGSCLKQVFEECGGFNSIPKRIAVGSPFLGRSVFSLDEPVSPYTYAVFAVADEKVSLNGDPRVLDLRSKYRAQKDQKDGFFAKIAKIKSKIKYASPKKCICCGECRRVCPLGLDPEKLYKKIAGKELDGRVVALASKCHGCGCCVAVCPSSLPLSHVIATSEASRFPSIVPQNAKQRILEAVERAAAIFDMEFTDGNS